jgi:shikimate dehydrogenase
VHDWVQAANMLDGARTVVNTTSLGMTGKPDFRVPLDALQAGMVVNDLVYVPLKTQLLIEAEAAGCTVVDGLGMLLHQAAPGFERWFGRRPDVDDDTRRAVLGP